MSDRNTTFTTAASTRATTCRLRRTSSPGQGSGRSCLSHALCPPSQRLAPMAPGCFRRPRCFTTRSCVKARGMMSLRTTWIASSAFITARTECFDLATRYAMTIPFTLNLPPSGMNEMTWSQVKRWEALHSHDNGQSNSGSRLVRFLGRPDELSPRARVKALFGGWYPATRVHSKPKCLSRWRSVPVLC